MKTENMISEGLTVNQLEERLEMANGLFLCCTDDVNGTCCGLGAKTDVNVNVTVNK
ncbi:MAG: hypothetical protein E6772_07320 [Dysgonomonas sp.]|nr:hypothetical protein [Dysgonomonas sp.]